MAQSSSVFAVDSSESLQRLSMLVQPMEGLQQLELQILQLHGKPTEVEATVISSTSDREAFLQVASPVDEMQEVDEVLKWIYEQDRARVESEEEAVDAAIRQMEREHQEFFADIDDTVKQAAEARAQELQREYAPVNLADLTEERHAASMAKYLKEARDRLTVLQSLNNSIPPQVLAARIKNTQVQELKSTADAKPRRELQSEYANDLLALKGMLDQLESNFFALHSEFQGLVHP
eukprot:4732180-Amphidinium_carterae.1